MRLLTNMKSISAIFLYSTLVFAVSQGASGQNRLPAEKVLVSNQKTQVTFAELEAELARIPQRDHHEFLLDRQRLAQLLDNILVNKTLALEARENKLDLLPIVQGEIRNQTDKVLAKHRGQQIQNNAPKTDLLSRAREAYLLAPERYSLPARHDVWHVLISTKGRTPDAARQRAEEVRTKIIAGQSREALATEYSDDPSAKDGAAPGNAGNLGPNPLSIYDPAFADAILKLKIGDVSPIIQTQFGYHVAVLLSVQPARKIPFETVKSDLLLEAENQYLATIWENHVTKVRNDPKLYVDNDAIDALRPQLPEQFRTPLPAKK